MKQRKPITHQFTGAWGNDIAISPRKGVYEGIGHSPIVLKVDDTILSRGGNAYIITKIDYYSDPTDMFRCTLLRRA